MGAGRSLLPLLLLAAALLCRASALKDIGTRDVSGQHDPHPRRHQLQQNCPENCMSCDSSGRCNNCFLSYTPVDGKCAPCTDKLCELCDAPAKCTGCALEADGFPVYLARNGSCLKCTQHPLSSGCEECDSDGRCSYCQDGWSLKGGRCTQCDIEGCLDCDPATKTCALCDMRKGLDANKRCRDCAGQRTDDGLDRPICLACDKDYRVCTACEKDFYPNAKGVCVPLPDGCLDADATGCTKCVAGLYPDAKGTCSLVPYGCTGANKSGCTGCEDDFYLTPRKTCKLCPPGCSRCTSATVCTKCRPTFILTPTKTCLSCGFDCEACTLASPGRVRCTKCLYTSLLDGACRRCEDPRCAECPGDVRRCKVCRNKAYVVNSATGRCQDPSWPQPCPQTANGSGGRQGKCGATPQKPTRGGSTTGRRLQADAESGSIARRKLIVGGRNAMQGRYPYMVSIRDSVDVRAPHFCGGALVHERVVLTAAHCMLDTLRWREESKVFSRVRIGGYEAEGGRFEARRVKWAVVHPGVYSNRGHTANDFALLLLDRPATTRPLLRLPAALPRPAAATGTQLTVMGWGLDYTFDSSGLPTEFLPPVLQETVIQMNSLKECASNYTADEKWDAQFCAGRRGTNTCRGDSGGPLIARSPSGPAGDLAVGLVSWAIGCFVDSAVFADVAAGSQWIRNATQWLLFEDAAGRIPGPATGPA